MVEVAKIIDPNNIKTNLVGETKDELTRWVV